MAILFTICSNNYLAQAARYLDTQYKNTLRMLGFSRY